MSAEPKTLDALDMIAIEAGQGEAEAQAATDAILNPEPEQVIDPAQTWAQIPMVIGGMLGMVMPELRQHYTEAACLTWGQGMAQVADKYGWDAGETISKWAPECALVIASVPLLLPTVAAIRARRPPPDKKKDADPQPEKNVVDLNDPMSAEPGGFSEPH